MKKQQREQPEDTPAMPFNEALKRVWSAPPMPKVKSPKGKQPSSGAAKKAQE